MVLESVYMCVCVGWSVFTSTSPARRRHNRVGYFRMEMGSNNVVAGQAAIYALDDKR